MTDPSPADDAKVAVCAMAARFPGACILQMQGMTVMLVAMSKIFSHSSMGTG